MSMPPPGFETSQASPPAPPRTDNVQYELKSVQAVRGRESSAKAKWHNQGWELVSENQGKLRTELNFRRVKPKTLGGHLLGIVATLRRMQPQTRLSLVVASALILVAGTGALVGTRSGGDTAKPSGAQSTASTAPSAAPTATGATESNEPDAERVVTADNNEEFAALLKRDYCDQEIAPFVAEYAGRTIAFNGSIANLTTHGDYKTRYDILVYPGNKGPRATVGPAFKFDDVNLFDLNLTKPGSVSEGDSFRFVAQVAEYNPTQCLLFLEPVSTRVR